MNFPNNDECHLKIYGDPNKSLDLLESDDGIIDFVGNISGSRGDDRLFDFPQILNQRYILYLLGVKGQK